MLKQKIEFRSLSMTKTNVSKPWWTFTSLSSSISNGNVLNWSVENINIIYGRCHSLESNGQIVIVLSIFNIQFLLIKLNCTCMTTVICRFFICLFPTKMTFERATVFSWLFSSPEHKASGWATATGLYALRRTYVVHHFFKWRRLDQQVNFRIISLKCSYYIPVSNLLKLFCSINKKVTRVKYRKTKL